MESSGRIREEKIAIKFQKLEIRQISGDKLQNQKTEY